MAGPKISEKYKYTTLPQTAKRLGIHPAKLRQRLKHGVFPPPTFINEYGLKFFDDDWLREAQVPYIWNIADRGKVGNRGNGPVL